MWRREERLEFWLRQGMGERRAGRIAWLKKLLMRQSLKRVQETDLEMAGRVISPEETLTCEASVHDGLGSMHCAAPENMHKFSREQEPAPVKVVDLLGAAPVHRLAMPDAHRTRIRQSNTSMRARARGWGVEIAPSMIRRVALLPDELTSVHGTVPAFPAAGIRTTEGISELPHMRRSIDVQMLKDSELSSFLHEASVMKQVPPDRAELLAVFRNMPIEIITRMRFIADKKQILYSVSGMEKRTQTRVHDIAVIRDSANQDIHMVPHRTRTRPVHLT